MSNQVISLEYKDDVTKKNYGSWDPWDPYNDCLVKGFSNILVSDNIYPRVQTPVFYDLGLPTFYIMAGCISTLQEYFSCLLKDYEPFLSGKNLLKIVKIYLHSLRCVNINFIEKFCGWLDNEKYPINTRLFRMLGIFVQYINYPECFETVVITENSRVKDLFTDDINKKLERILEDK